MSNLDGPRYADAIAHLADDCALRAVAVCDD